MANADPPEEFQQIDAEGADDFRETSAPAAARRPWTAKKRWQLSLVLCLLLAIALGLAWANRKEIADDFIVQELEALGLEASYDIAEIGSERQTLRNIVIGDPVRPDLTIEEVSVAISFPDFVPTIGRITVVEPRLYGSYRDGTLSFGKLDPLLFTESDEPFALPEYDIALVDGRAALESDFGDIGFKLDGEGLISDGFAGVLAVNAPELSVEGCNAIRATIYGDIAITSGAPAFNGPVRAGSVKCPAQSLALADFNAQTQIVLPADLSQVDGNAVLELAELNVAGTAATKVAGNVSLVWAASSADAPLTNVKYDLTSDRIGGGEFSLTNIAAMGGVRVRGAMERAEADVELSGDNLRAGEAAIASLAGYEEQAAGTLGAPLIAKLRRGLNELGKRNRLTANVTAKQTGDVITAVIPDARLKGTNGGSAIALSNVQYRSGTSLGTRLSGNFVTNGRDLPQLSGRMEQRPNGALALRMRMQEFRSGDASLGLPEMEIIQSANGNVRFAGIAIANGDIPSGMVRSLSMPVEGSWTPNGSLDLWARCTNVSFAALEVADLSLGRRNLQLCPKGRAAVLTVGNEQAIFDAKLPALNLAGNYGGEPFQIAAGSASVDASSALDGSNYAANAIVNGLSLGGSAAGANFRVATNQARIDVSSAGTGLDAVLGTGPLNIRGDLGGTPFVMTSGAADLNWPGAANLSDVDITLGNEDAPNRFTLSSVAAELGDVTSGTFSGADALLDAVPLDITEASGNFTYAAGILDVEDAQFNLFDREEIDRFAPMLARDATLTFKGNVITAQAMMRHAAKDREVSLVDLTHSLDSGLGDAILTVDTLTFDDNFQPDELTYLVDGVVELAQGSISGTGAINWTSDTIESSGAFSTNNFDFAAAFGPVQGVKGTVNFTDLINLTTAPNQKVEIASINPGIEVLAGEITYEVRDTQVVDLKAAEWPFMGGTLIMEPVVLDFSKSEERPYTFEMEGLDAASFVAQMELANLSATGTFDGKVPIIFDEMGNGRIEDSTLTARSPGGNVSYIGELTYEDMGFISNFAFNMLKSLDYTGMRIGIEGPLSGILSTKVEIDGVQQGEGASRNILTRELAKLPVQLNVNVNAPLQELFAVMQSVYSEEEYDIAEFKSLFGAKPVEQTSTPSDDPIQLEESEQVP
ncbi:MAG: YdbH domain-containing protein [Erythrobacter sp.]